MNKRSGTAAACLAFASMLSFQASFTPQAALADGAHSKPTASAGKEVASDSSGTVQGITTSPIPATTSSTPTQAPDPIPGQVGPASATPPAVPASAPPAPKGPPNDFPAQNESGSGNNFAPSDLGLAVSSSYIVEVVNSSISVYTRSTSPTLLGHFTLNSLAAVTNGGTCIDPTVTYWSWDARFAFGCETIGTGTDDVVVVSKTSSPLGQWCAFPISPSQFLDQQSFTVSADKIVEGGQGSSGYQWWSFDKAPMLTCGFATYQHFTSTHGPYRAALHITNEFDAKFVSVSGSHVWLGDFAGAPGSTTLTETQIGGVSFTVYPDVIVPGGKLGDNDLDNRPLVAIQEQETMDNHYVMVFATHIKVGANIAVAIYRVDFTASGNVISSHWNDAYTGFDLTMPGITLDAYGHVFVSYSFSGPSNAPEAVEDAYPPTGTTRYFSTEIFGATAGTTSCNGTMCDERWGDYQAGAPDPTNATYVWMASQYQLANGEFGWGTVIAQSDDTHVH
jgi:hypothetical protein